MITAIQNCQVRLNRKSFKVTENFMDEADVRKHFDSKPDVLAAILASEETITCKYSGKLYPVPSYLRTNENEDTVSQKRQRDVELEEKVKKPKVEKKPAKTEGEGGHVIAVWA